MKYALFLSVLFSAAACSEKVDVHVKCITTAAPAVECDVQQTKGKAEVEACWDMKVTCGNGGIVTAPHWCQKVKDGATVKTTIPGDKLTGLDGCANGSGGGPTAVLENMTINGEKSTN